jgi:nucleoside-diphosphate-sugar epimerase
MDAQDKTILVTGGTGFLGSRLVNCLLNETEYTIRLLVRSRSKAEKLFDSQTDCSARLQLIEGNLLSPEHCKAAVDGASIIYHLAAGTGTKSFPEAFRNSVVTTRNLLDAAVAENSLERFVNTSSFTVYTGRNKPKSRILDESCPEEALSHERDAYTFAKSKQDELVREYGDKGNLPYVIVRPGVVYGPGKPGITSSRIGIDALGWFFHLGGSNQIPFTYKDNCAEAIMLTGLKPDIEGEVFNIVDDDLYTSRKFLRSYKQQVKRFRSVYVPRPILHLGCFIWEKYCNWSDDQLPPIYNRKAYYAFWKRTRYSNDKLKRLTGWEPRVTMAEGMDRFFKSCNEA